MKDARVCQELCRDASPRVVPRCLSQDHRSFRLSEEEEERLIVLKALIFRRVTANEMRPVDQCLQHEYAPKGDCAQTWQLLEGPRLGRGG